MFAYLLLQREICRPVCGHFCGIGYDTGSVDFAWRSLIVYCESFIKVLLVLDAWAYGSSYEMHLANICQISWPVFVFKALQLLHLLVWDLVKLGDLMSRLQLNSGHTWRGILINSGHSPGHEAFASSRVLLH